MDNRPGVRDVDGLGHGGAHLQHAIDVQPLVGNEIAQRLPFDQFHRDERAPVSFLDRVDGHDTRMIEGRGGSRLTDESTDTIWDPR